MNKSNIDKWSEEYLLYLKEFIEYWKKQNYKDPINFPLELSNGEWDEQFSFYFESKKRPCSLKDEAEVS